MTSLNQIFERFNRQKILIIGDVMVDAYVWGAVSRISPEAPVPVLSSVSYDYRLGGAANVAKNIYALGAKPILCSVIGKDEYGQRFLTLMEKNGHAADSILRSTKRKTTVKTRFISRGQHLIRIDEEDVHPLGQEFESELIAHIKKQLTLQPIDAIIFQDYDKGVLSKNLIEKVILIAKEKNIPLLADPKKRNFNFFNGIQLFKPNLKEFSEGTNVDFEEGNYEQLFKVAKKYLQKYQIDNVMITLSEKGVFICNEHNYYHYPAVVREIADVSGAGDTVISTAAVCLAAGLSPELIAQISNLAGGIVCEHSVVVPIDKKELLNECEQMDF